MTKASSRCHFVVFTFLCVTFRRVFDSSHCLMLTEVSLLREVECLSSNWFLFHPRRFLFNDLSTVAWSLVKLASALGYLFHAIRWKLSWYTLFSFQEKWLWLLSCVVLLSYLWCPLSFLGGATLFWVVRCLPTLLLVDRAYNVLFWSPRMRYVICHWLDRRWCRQLQLTISRISAFIILLS